MLEKFFAGKTFHKDLVKHETKRHVLLKFLLVLAIFFGYFFFISQEYGAGRGIFVTFLTWSFFVMCTPIADAGFLLDFPIRLITRLKMMISEIIVWFFAISLNIYSFFLYPEIYSKTKILNLFKHILESPIPFWSIIFISMIGTFISIQFGDELMDKVRHKERALHQKHKHHYRLIIMIFIFGMAFILYDFLLKELGVNVPL